MALKREDAQEIESYLQQRDSNIAKSIIVAAIIIAISNLFAGGVIHLKRLDNTATLPSASPAAAAQLPNVPGSPTPAPKVTMALGHLPAKGSNNAKIGIIEFADFRCPFCEQYFTQTEPQLLKDYVDSGKAKYIFRHFEFLGPASITAGNAAECASEQGKFWEYHDWLYKNQPPETDTSMYISDKLTTAATELGLNGSQFKSCLDSSKYSSKLSDDQSEATAAGVSGTPSFIIGKIDPTGTKIINGTLLVGAQPYSAFKSAIDPLLQ